MTRGMFFARQTEDVFCSGKFFGRTFQRMNIWLTPIIIRTGPQGKGGVSSYAKIKRQVERKCKEDKTAWVTTMLDFYGLPSDFPASFNRRLIAKAKC